MTFQELQINRLSETGEVQRRIRCLNGRVTVFRAYTPSEIEVYKRAITAKSSGNERFSILLDGVTLVPDEHIFLGFGEPELTSAEMLTEHFLNAGIKKDCLDSMLLMYGLGGMGTRKVSELLPAEKTIVQMITATQSNTKVLVLNEPFSSVPEQWREPLAQRLVEFAWGKKAIVVVVALSYRPACWIDNEFVTRVQLEGVRSATIGFGSGALSSAPLMKEARSRLLSESLGKSSSYSAVLNNTSVLEEDPDTTSSTLNWKLVKWGVSAGVLAIGLAVATPSLDRTLKSPDRERLAVNQVVLSETVPQPKTDPIAEEPVPATMNLLEKYPHDVADSIAKAFENVLPASLMDHSPVPQFELFKSLTVEEVPGADASNNTQNNTGVNYNSNDTVPSDTNPTPEELEANEVSRENIRQRFLEAIMKAEADQ